MRGPAPFKAPRFSGIDVSQSEDAMQAFKAQWVPVTPDRRALQAKTEKEESCHSSVGDSTGVQVAQSDPAMSRLPLYEGNEPAPPELVTDPESLARQMEFINLQRQENVAIIDGKLTVKYIKIYFQFFLHTFI